MNWHKIKFDSKPFIRYLTILVIGVIIGYLIKGNGGTHEEENYLHEDVAKEYTCSMHPQIRQDGPGKCPLCGMDLVPISSGDDGSLTEF